MLLHCTAMREHALKNRVRTAGDSREVNVSPAYDRRGKGGLALLTGVSPVDTAYPFEV